MYLKIWVGREKLIQLQYVLSQITNLIEYLFSYRYEGTVLICDNPRSSWNIIDERNLPKRISWVIIDLPLLFTFLNIFDLHTIHSF